MTVPTIRIEPDPSDRPPTPPPPLSLPPPARHFLSPAPLGHPAYPPPTATRRGSLAWLALRSPPPRRKRELLEPPEREGGEERKGPTAEPSTADSMAVTTSAADDVSAPDSGSGAADMHIVVTGAVEDAADAPADVNVPTEVERQASSDAGLSENNAEMVQTSATCDSGTSAIPREGMTATSDSLHSEPLSPPQPQPTPPPPPQQPYPTHLVHTAGAILTSWLRNRLSPFLQKPDPAMPQRSATHASPEVASPAPPSAHDAVVNALLARPARPPAPPRSASLPVAPHPETPPTDERAASDTEDLEDARPISALLDGPLEAGGGRVTRALAAQIEAVLAAQEEIGRAHLALENVGCEREDEKDEDKAFENLEKRAKSVTDIMDKLSELSRALKSYHAIGTPVIAFPRRANSGASPATQASPQIRIAHPGVARAKLDSPWTPLDSLSRGGSGASASTLPSFASPLTMSPAGMTPVGNGPPHPVVVTAPAVSGLSSDMPALAPSPSATLPSVPASSPRIRKGPNVWIQRAGLAPETDESHFVLSPAEMTPAHPKPPRPW